MAIELRIEVLNIEPLIWRKVLVAPDITLDALHLVIQGAMGWQDCHLHMFIIDDTKYEPQFEDDFESEEETQDEAKFKLSSLVKTNSEFEYFYDFGDNWHHRIIVSGISDKKIEASHCVGGERACPPEDCGGPYGYPDFLDALSDKNHPEHEQYSQWADGFEPESFNISQADALIAALSR